MPPTSLTIREDASGPLPAKTSGMHAAATLKALPHKHVIASAPASILLAAALPLAAAGVAVAASPAEIEGFVLVGALLAVFISVTYLRFKMPASGFYSIAFTVLTTFAVGWLAPEPLVWYFSGESAAHLPRKAWAFYALLAGLCGSTFIVAILKVIEKKLPGAVEQVVTAHLPGGGRVNLITPAAKDKEKEKEKSESEV